jgi:hypothetical protein
MAVAQKQKAEGTSQKKATHIAHRHASTYMCMYTHMSLSSVGSLVQSQLPTSAASFCHPGSTLRGPHAAPSARARHLGTSVTGIRVGCLAVRLSSHEGHPGAPTTSRTPFSSGASPAHGTTARSTWFICKVQVVNCFATVHKWWPWCHAFI